MSRSTGPTRARALSRALERLPGLVFEAHSTDYQPAAALAALVEDGFAILKVGPGLTFALREALYGLDAIATELRALAPEESVERTMERVMLENPAHWRSHYPGTPEEQRLQRHFSYSDRIRYYWPDPRAVAAVDRLMDRLGERDIPQTLISQYLSRLYPSVLAGSGLAPAARPLPRCCRAGAGPLLGRREGERRLRLNLACRMPTDGNRSATSAAGSVAERKPSSAGSYMLSYTIRPLGTPISVSLPAGRIRDLRGSAAGTTIGRSALGRSSMAIQRHKGLADDVYEAIFNKLMSLEISPGARITVDGLVRELGVSHTPIREALGRLEGEGLVVKTHLVGYSAAPQITRRRFDELYELRLLLEPDGARRAALRVSDERLSKLRETAGLMSKLSNSRERLSYSGFARLDADYHDQIMEIAGNELIRDTLAHLHTHFHIFRLMYHARVTEEALSEHDALLTALSGRDELGAERAMRNHIERSRHRLLEAFA